MRMRHPFEWLTESKHRGIFLSLLLLTLIVSLGLTMLSRPLKTEIAPYGIVSFELAGNPSLSRKIIQSWGESGRVYAGLNLGLDYLYIVAYSCCIGMGCILISRSLPSRNKLFAEIGIVVAWGQLVAGLLDAIENYALIQILLGAETNSLAVSARLSALCKFLIVAVGIGYILAGVVSITVAKFRIK